MLMLEFVSPVHPIVPTLIACRVSSSTWMPSSGRHVGVARIFMVRGNAKLSPDMAFGLFYYVPLHNIRDGILPRHI
jgi:hypothetical protein